MIKFAPFALHILPPADAYRENVYICFTRILSKRLLVYWHFMTQAKWMQSRVDWKNLQTRSLILPLSIPVLADTHWQSDTLGPDCRRQETNIKRMHVNIHKRRYVCMCMVSKECMLYTNTCLYIYRYVKISSYLNIYI